MKGLIIINPYLTPKESVEQAKRIKYEFENLGVDTEIVSDAFLRTAIEGDKIQSRLPQADFIIYLDKDKYQSELLEKMGYRLFNSHTAIRVCDDKARTFIVLSNSGIDMPKTIFGGLCYASDKGVDKNHLERIAKSLGYPVIVKECYGSMGKGVYKADNIDELLKIAERVKVKPHLFQQYVACKSGVDVRVIVIGGRAIGGIERQNEGDFRSNVARGGKAVKIELNKEFKEIAERVAKVLALDYCGVDLLYGKDNKPIVCEVNSNAFFGGFESATGVNVAKEYAKYVIKSINGQM